MTISEGPAKFSYQGGADVVVDFNPTSLDYTVTNTLQSGKGKRPAQIVSQSSAKLTMELIFDSTNTGEDVRVRTRRVAMLMRPGGGQAGKERDPLPTVTFSWGSFSFVGYVDSFKEKIDFFSAKGIPLRSTVGLSMTQQDLVFESVEGASDVNASIPLSPPVGFTSPASDGATGGAPKLGLDLGAPALGASASAGVAGLSMKSPGGSDAAIASGDLGSAGLAPSASASPSAASGAASSGGNTRSSSGATSTAASASNASASGQRATSARNQPTGGTGSTGASASRSSARASAGVSATEGAFAGLGQRTSPRVDPASDLARPMRAPMPDERGSGPEVSYRIGGQAMSLSAGSAVADVGQTVRLAERIRFDRGGDGG